MLNLFMVSNQPKTKKKSFVMIGVIVALAMFIFAATMAYAAVTRKTIPATITIVAPGRGDD